MSMETLDRLGEEYFRQHFAADPLLAGVFGAPGFEADVPDPSRAAAERHRAEPAQVLETVPPRVAVTAGGQSP
jgi:hypothetical protein